MYYVPVLKAIKDLKTLPQLISSSSHRRVNKPPTLSIFKDNIIIYYNTHRTYFNFFS